MGIYSFVGYVFKDLTVFVMLMVLMLQQCGQEKGYQLLPVTEVVKKHVAWEEIKTCFEMMIVGINFFWRAQKRGSQWNGEALFTSKKYVLFIIHALNSQQKVWYLSIYVHINRWSKNFVSEKRRRKL